MRQRRAAILVALAACASTGCTQADTGSLELLPAPAPPPEKPKPPPKDPPDRPPPPPRDADCGAPPADGGKDAEPGLPKPPPCPP